MDEQRVPQQIPVEHRLQETVDTGPWVKTGGPWLTTENEQL